MHTQHTLVFVALFEHNVHPSTHIVRKVRCVSPAPWVHNHEELFRWCFVGLDLEAFATFTHCTIDVRGPKANETRDLSGGGGT